MKTKRLIAMLLCAMMLVSLLPAAVFADEGEDEEIVEVSFDAEEAEEALPEEPAEEEAAEEPAEEEETVEDEVIPEEDEAAEDGELPAEEEEILPEEPENEAAENEFEAAAGTCGSSATWSLTNSGVLTIKGTGNMDDYSVSNPGWLDSGIIVRTVKVEEGITSIGGYAFYSLRDAARVSLPGSLINIDKCAFMDCGITEIVIPASVTSIGERAFAKNPGLTVIRFMGNAPGIASDAFSNVSAAAYYPVNNSTWTDSNKLNYGGEINWTSAAYGTYGENISWSVVGNTLTISGTGKIPDYPIPWNDYRTVIENVIIENGITAIGVMFIQGYSAVKSVSIPNSVTEISHSAFNGLSSLKSVTIPGSIKEMGVNVFSNCEILENITIEEGAECIGIWMCGRCPKIKSVTIPGSVKSIGSSAFSECDSLVDVIFEEGITSLGQGGAFGYCSSIETVRIPSTVTEVAPGVFDDCPSLSRYIVSSANKVFTSVDGVLFSNGGKTLIRYPAGKDTSSYSIPEGVTSVADRAFYECDKLAYLGIPASLTDLDQSAIAYCNNIKGINVNSNNPVYKSVNGILFTKDEKTLIFYPAGKTNTEYTVPASAETVGEYAFNSNPYLTNVSIPGSVTEIKRSAFSRCTGLVNVTFSKGLKTLGNFVFNGCSSLGNISLPDTLLSIGDYAFEECENFTNVTIPASVTYIGMALFAYCETPKTVKFLGNAPDMDDNAFYDSEITAYYPAGNKTWTSDVMQQYGGTVTWKPYGGSTAPVFTTIANHADYMIVCWNKVEGATSYQLAYREGSSAWQTMNVTLLMVDSKGNPRVNIKNLKQGVTYTFIAYALFADGTKTKSESAAQTRLLSPAVTAKAGNGFIALNWNEVQGGSQYKIYYREKGGSWQMYAWVKKGVTSINIKESVISANGLTPLIKGHTYEFAVILGTSVAGITSGFPTAPVSVKY